MQVTHWVMMHGLMHSLRIQNPQHVHMDVLNGKCQRLATMMWHCLASASNARAAGAQRQFFNVCLSHSGIAYDAKGGRLFVTGKMWPKVFEVKLQPGKPGVTLDSARRMCIKQGSL
jgi:hypothetical protein